MKTDDKQKLDSHEIHPAAVVPALKPRISSSS